jgi:hypothetical protein
MSSGTTPSSAGIKDGARSSLHYENEGIFIHPSHQGVCGRHGREDPCVTPGELDEFPRGGGIRLSTSGSVSEPTHSIRAYQPTRWCITSVTDNRVHKRLSLPNAPSRRILAIHLAQWSYEIVAKKSGFSDWIKEEMVSSGSILNLDRIILVKGMIPIALWRLGSLSIIPMMQCANHRFFADRSELRWLNQSRLRAVLLQSKMGAALVVVAKILLEHPPEMLLVENDRMVQTFPPDPSDQSLNVRILPRGPS